MTSTDVVSFALYKHNMRCLNVLKISVVVRAASKTSEVFKRKMSSTPEQLKQTFASAVSSVEPRELIRKAVVFNNGHLTVRHKSYPLRKPCYVVGFGKAVLGMALEIEEILGDQLQEGICTVPDGIFKCFENKSQYAISGNSKIRFVEGAKDNLPDAKAMHGATDIKNLVEKLTEDDLLIVLISGGGSALLPLPRNGITLAEKLELIKKLGSKGADILELNCLRKKLSQLKGGGLAELAYPAKTVALIISDVIGDPLDYIGSGPTTVNKDRNTDALNILNKYEITDQVPRAILKLLEADELSHNEAIVSSGNYVHVDNYIIGNNHIAASAAVNHARSLGFPTHLLSTAVKGDVTHISKLYAQLVLRAVSHMQNPTPETKETFHNALQHTSYLLGGTNTFEDFNFDDTKTLCFVAGGETTVNVNGTGKGGRNQHLALAFSLDVAECLKGIEDVEVWFLSCGTDGIDGPTDAAGAIGIGDLARISRKEGIHPEEYLKNSDSYGFYEKFCGGKFLVKIGHTGTNVMDIHVLLIKSASK